MRFASCAHGERRFAALVEGDVVRPLRDVPELGRGTPAELLADPPVSGERLPLADVVLRPVVPRPGKIICMGLNYREHVDEGVFEVPDYPVLFPKFAEALVGHGEPIVLPPESEAVDYEAELAFVVGREVRRASREDALGAVAGYTIANDVTMRDFQYRTHQWLAGKTWASSTPLGQHFTVTRALPRLRALLGEAGVRATFFVEGRNAELYPDALRELAADGHEVALHGWCHEPWASLEAGRERELLDHGRGAMGALGLDVRGFRPPGGRLTDRSLALLRDAGFTHCSPAGSGTAVLGGVAVLPFRWELVDAFYALPRFAALRGSAEPRPAEDHARALAAALDAVLREGGHLSVLFHPFLLDDEARLGVLRGFLRALDDAGVRSVPHGEVAAATPADGDLRLDLTPA